jgi:16S rRNA (guanine966-N2)-methyltransferase
MATRRTNSVRIIAGEWRSRRVEFPDVAGLRPTPDRVRETLFNWLGQDLTGKRCLDLFAGSGALGFEALSRGAREVVFVERSAPIRRAIASSADRLGAARMRLIAGDALEFASTTPERFDIAFVDPPYGSGLVEAVLPQMPRLLNAGALVYAEGDREFSAPQPWRLVKAGRAGAVHYCLIEWGEVRMNEAEAGEER